MFKDYLEMLNSTESFSVRTVEQYLIQKLNLATCKRSEYAQGNDIMYSKAGGRFDHDDVSFDLLTWQDEVLLKFNVRIAVSVEDPGYRNKIDSAGRIVKFKTIKLDVGVDNQIDAEKQINRFSKKLIGTQWVKRVETKNV